MSLNSSAAPYQTSLQDLSPALLLSSRHIQTHWRTFTPFLNGGPQHCTQNSSGATPKLNSAGSSPLFTGWFHYVWCIPGWGLLSWHEWMLWLSAAFLSLPDHLEALRWLCVKHADYPTNKQRDFAKDSFKPAVSLFVNVSNGHCNWLV